jgi:large subunit ribosomal protein L29
VKTKELREKTSQELRGLMRTLEEELFNARFQHYNGQLENTQKLVLIRRNIARVKTMLHQRELGLAHGPEETTPVGRT